MRSLMLITGVISYREPFRKSRGKIRVGHGGSLLKHTATHKGYDNNNIVLL